MALTFLPVLVGSTWALVAALAGRRVPLLLVVAAVPGVVGTVAVAAACAAHAMLRRRWRWATALVVAWPGAVPLYLWRRSSAT